MLNQHEKLEKYYALEGFVKMQRIHYTSYIHKTMDEYARDLR